MNCQLFERYVFDYCDDNLSPDLKAKMDKHRQECPRCNNQVKLTYLENQVLRDTSDLPVLADDFTSRVMQQVTGADQATLHLRWTRKPFSSKVKKYAWTAAAVGLVLCLAILAPNVIQNDKITQVADAPSAEIGKASVLNSSVQSPLPDSKLDAQSGTSRVYNERLSPQVSSTEGAGISPAQEYSPNETAPDNDLSAEVSSEIMMSAMADPGSQDTGVFDQTAEPANPPSDMMLWKASDVQSPSRQGSAPNPVRKSDAAGDLPKPQLVPGTFTLINVVSSDLEQEGSIIEYHYTDKNNRLLVIALQDTNKAEPNTLLNNELLSSASPQKEAEVAPPSQVEVTYNIDVDGHTYQVTLNGTLSAEELGKLAETISFSNNSTVSSQ